MLLRVVVFSLAIIYREKSIVRAGNKALQAFNALLGVLVGDCWLSGSIGLFAEGWDERIIVY